MAAIRVQGAGGGQGEKGGLEDGSTSPSSVFKDHTVVTVTEEAALSLKKATSTSAKNSSQVVPTAVN